MTYVSGTDMAVTSSLGNTVNVNEIGGGVFGIDTLAAGDDIEITISLMINLDFMGTSLVNVAEISQSSNALDSMDIDSDSDIDPDNDSGGNPDTPSDDVTSGDGTGMPGDTLAMTDEDDSDPAIIMINQVFDLALIKQLSSMGPFAPGDVVDYTITVYNQGTLAADSATITDYVPVGMTYVSGTDMAVTSSLGNTVNVNEIGAASSESIHWQQAMIFKSRSA